jgi:hypothetical protein
MFISGTTGNVSGVLRALFNNATCFGLSDEATWRAMDDALVAVGREATVSEYLDELAGRLARGILVNERDASQSGDTERAR